MFEVLEILERVLVDVVWTQACISGVEGLINIVGWLLRAKVVHFVPSVLLADGLLAARILLRHLNFFVFLYYSLDDEAVYELNRFDVLILNTV